ncbi:Glyoxalase/Bleomycin resistance protein/Dihydroxybiphenyl dioxygenase [Aspergillus granulosus]|uniref:Glyoxalase/Bleomycin resistance protein/Dihydroxybiphenyl dioxygenase n=1 Tax=Aspergillus granulosus TaxID=176169 RepID=A0ABR4HF43_9EURO
MASHLLNSAWKVIPMFESRSVERTVEFYTEKLGFELASVKPEPESQSLAETRASALYFCSLFVGKKAEANIYFSAVDSKDFKASSAMIALGTEELDEFYKYLTGLADGMGVDIVEPVEDKEWGFRQFTIKDPDGNVLTFFKFLEGGNPGNG